MKRHIKTFLFAVCCFPALQASQVLLAATHDVDIVGFAFSPASLTVQMGDSVRWTQMDDFIQHTTTSGSPPGMPDGLWNSGLMSSGQSFTNLFNMAGNFPYYCEPHFSTMSASVTVQGGATAPTVSINSPTNGASFPVTNTITIEAMASDSDGNVTQVEFFDGTNSLGIDTTTTYGVTTNLTVGGHTLTAVAKDNVGLMTTSAPVNITIRTVPIANPIPEKIAKGDLSIELQAIVDGLGSPLGMAVPDDGTGRMFVYDQAGLVWVISQGLKLPTPLLDVQSRLTLLGPYDERGLLGMAAHPNFTQHPLIYTYTSEPNSGPADFPTTLPPGATNNHQSVVAEWRISAANTNQIDPSSRRELLRIDQPQFNHNGGTMRFGPDSLLYISLGDGGLADDQGDGHSPGGNGQDTTNILGKVIRINVDGSNSVNGRYGLPADNPFVGIPGVDEIYAYGFRNPYSFSFDRMSGVLYLGDVGQNALEEVDIVTKGGNYGWNIKEGTFFFDPNGSGAGYVTDIPVRPVPPDLIDPIAQYDHDEGLAVVAGYIYRGSAIPTLQGRYVMADWGNFSVPSGRLFYLDASNNVKEFHIGLDDRALGLWVKGFGEDANGELYVFASRVLGPTGNTGKMLKIIPAPAPIQFTSVAKNGTNLTADWTGGLGPFALQKRTSLTDPFWANQTFSALRNTVTPAEDNTAFFRTADAARQGIIPLTTWLSGLMERPTPVTNGASGSGTFLLDDDTLFFNIRYANLFGPASAAHIHGPAPASLAAAVLIDLAPFNGGSFGSSGTVSGVVILTPSQKAMVLAGLTYVNFHTGANPGGELRGQIAPVMMQTALSSANERPDPNDDGGTGLGTLTLAGNQLTMHVSYQDLTGPATAAHIHGPATASQANGVLVDLSPYNGGAFGAAGSLVGTIPLTAQQLGWVMDGLTYVNIHTGMHPGGETRGQLLAQSTTVPLTAWLSGLMERPTPVTNSASGSGSFSLEGNTLLFNVRYRDLTGPATAAHIHGPAPASLAAGVLIDLAPYNGGSFGSSGAVSGRITLTSAQRAMVLSGQTNVNFHTGANPGGELRGQIAVVAMQTSLSGLNERPTSVFSPGTGAGTFALLGNELIFNLTYSGLTGAANAAHIHGPAGVFQATGVLVDLAPYNGGGFGASGSLAGAITLTAEQLAHVIDGQTYINFHTSANPGGEIRGQLTR